jgi:hypothetical protein
MFSPDFKFAKLKLSSMKPQLVPNHLDIGILQICRISDSSRASACTKSWIYVFPRSAKSRTPAESQLAPNHLDRYSLDLPNLGLQPSLSLYQILDILYVSDSSRVSA